ncbi:helix-turn-helix domain-containing protein [Nocardia sp. CA-135953]|uniref:helix-turn-helix domain-containing protein n=1 Tax=Nocardia sp. CA-135953 TaxID=3239978 RepID=UPI003D965EA9
MENEQRWTIDDVAEFLNVPVDSVREWRKKGYGPPARKVGKHLRWNPAAVRDWFDQLPVDDAA